MNYIGKIIHLFTSRKDKKTRLSTESLTLDTQGIQEDKFYAKDINRSILITTVQSYSLALEHKISMPYGILGENILLDCNPYNLPIKTKLQIGQDIIIEISQPCTMCDHLSKIDTQLPILLKKDRGIFAKVIQGGIVQKGDKVYLVNT
jgi:MOSC domain-containing protein YiiM